MAKPQQADCHLFTTPVNSSVTQNPLLSPVPQKTLPARAIVKQIALAALAELALSLTVAVCISQFVIVPNGASAMVGIALIQCIANCFLRTIGALAARPTSTGCMGKLCSKIAEACNGLIAFNFAVGTTLNGQILIHEGGHALAGLALYKNSRPTITLFPFAEGLTHFSSRTLSGLGKKLGEKGARMAVTAAGPLLSLFASSVAFTSSALFQKEHPQISLTLQATAITGFATHVLYAFSALFCPPNNSSHDFALLWKAGLHPLSASLAIAAIPIALSAIKKSLENKNAPR